MVQQNCLSNLSLSSPERKVSLREAGTYRKKAKRNRKARKKKEKIRRRRERKRKT